MTNQAPEPGALWCSGGSWAVERIPGTDRAECPLDDCAYIGKPVGKYRLRLSVHKKRPVGD